MGDSYSDPQINRGNFENSRNGNRGGFRGGRGGGNREGGGFRIRLSDNEMRSARAIQEAFNLRSTVAALGFALRTVGEMLEQGKLDDFVNEYRSQNSRNNYRESQESRFHDRRDEKLSTGIKPNPFARPAKPEPNQENKELEVHEDLSNSENITSDSTETEKQKINEQSKEIQTTDLKNENSSMSPSNS